MSETEPAHRTPYIVGPRYDWAFILLPPSLALLVGIAISGSAFSNQVYAIGSGQTTAAALFMGTLVQAHLVAVVFRSHANPSIFRRHPLRFTLVPIVLWLSIVSSVWVAITATVVATFWDVWHSGAQTFGFARIYDRNAGNPGERGRWLDFWMNQLLYAGPILAGATMMDHVDAFEDYDELGASLLTSIPARAESFSGAIAIGVIAAGTIFVMFYLVAQLRFHREGQRVSPLKTFLMATTGLCSIYTWGFNSWGEAFFIMNLFHAVQYLALVWAMERDTMVERFDLGEGREGVGWAAVLFFGSIGVYGVGAELLDPGVKTVWALTIVVSLMHFWYDGFIWSVRRSEV